MSALVWPALAIVALAWPSRALGPLDGLPLNGRAEALLIGLVIPALLWLNARALNHRVLRGVASALLLLKIGSMALTPQGLCARFSTTAPFVGETHTIPIVEPSGWLRSWDIRADWGAETPQCTAIVDRAYASGREFPAWFVNLVDSIRPGHRDLSMAVAGVMHVTSPGMFSLPVAKDMTITGTIGGVAVNSAAAPVLAALPAGNHAIALQASLVGSEWSLQPSWNGTDAWSTASFTRGERTALDWLAPAIAFATTLTAGSLVLLWTLATLLPWREELPVIAWAVVASIVMAIAAGVDSLYRVAPLLLGAAVAIPVRASHRNLKTAFLLIGMPWLAFFAARALPEFGRFTSYTHDDWLAYQVAAYRIYMGGYWLEGGNLAFDYQPLYRWICGAVHVVFGDSSAGEILLDASSLLAGALLTFSIVKMAAGFRWAIAASAAVLMTFEVGTTWYFVGRGLSEISAAGCGFLAAFMLLRGRLGRPRSIVAAGLFCGLMFYTRLNFLIAGLALVALLLPLRVSSSIADLTGYARHLRVRSAIVYVGVVGTSVFLFMTRTWWYTGRFSALYGTSLKNNDIGLRIDTVAEPAVWQKIAHSLATLVFVNEPPHVDPRAAFVIAGTIVIVLATLQVPVVRRLPAVVTLAALGTFASGFFVHTHNYPGRMSIPLIPFACAAAAIGARQVMAAGRRAW